MSPSIGSSSILILMFVRLAGRLSPSKSHKSAYRTPCSVMPRSDKVSMTSAEVLRSSITKRLDRKYGNSLPRSIRTTVAKATASEGDIVVHMTGSGLESRSRSAIRSGTIARSVRNRTRQSCLPELSKAIANVRGGRRHHHVNAKIIFYKPHSETIGADSGYWSNSAVSPGDGGAISRSTAPTACKTRRRTICSTYHSS